MSDRPAGDPTAPRPVDIDVSPGNRIVGDLAAPDGAASLVVFAHGSGSGRRSPRNRAVAATLRDAGLATLLVDLLTPDEEAEDLRTGHLRFDVELLAGRLIATTEWAVTEISGVAGSIGYFGASTGAAAALIAAARRPDHVSAVVSRGGRPDLAGDELRQVRAPTLLIVGSLDEVVLRLNRTALDLLAAERRLEIVGGATHLFEEPGALEIVARLAAEWLVEHLQPSSYRNPRRHR